MKAALQIGVRMIVVIVLAIFLLIAVMVIYFTNTGGLSNLVNNVTENYTFGGFPS